MSGSLESSLADVLGVAAPVAGATLGDEIVTFILGTPGMSRTRFGKEALWGPSAVADVERSGTVRAETVERVRRYIADFVPCEPEEEEPSANAQQSALYRASAAEEREALDERRGLSDRAASSRRPGESIAEAVAREAREAGERRMGAFRPHPDAALMAESPRDRFRRLAAEVAAEDDDGPIRKISRAFAPLSPAIWRRLRELAAQTGEPPMALLPRVVEQGLDAMGGAQ